MYCMFICIFCAHHPPRGHDGTRSGVENANLIRSTAAPQARIGRTRSDEIGTAKSLFKKSTQNNENEQNEINNIYGYIIKLMKINKHNINE